jgi:hypothetical protein
VQRLPSLRPPAPMAACLLVAAGLVVGGVRAEAQVTGSFTDPLVLELTSDPADPPRFEKDGSPARARTGQPATFAPASGAGVTGFDSTNARRKARPKPEDETKSSAQPIAPGTAALQVRSPYQQPIPPLPGEPGVAAPGTPPVEYGPVRKPNRRRARPDEPVDPYEQLGIRAAAFIFYPAIELTGGYDSNPDKRKECRVWHRGPGTAAAVRLVAS